MWVCLVIVEGSYSADDLADKGVMGSGFHHLIEAMDGQVEEKQEGDLISDFIDKIAPILALVGGTLLAVAPYLQEWTASLDNFKETTAGKWLFGTDSETGPTLKGAGIGRLDENGLGAGVVVGRVLREELGALGLGTGGLAELSSERDEEYQKALSGLEKKERVGKKEFRGLSKGEGLSFGTRGLVDRLHDASVGTDGDFTSDEKTFFNSILGDYNLNEYGDVARLGRDGASGKVRDELRDRGYSESEVASISSNLPLDELETYIKHVSTLVEEYKGTASINEDTQSGILKAGQQTAQQMKQLNDGIANLLKPGSPPTEPLTLVGGNP